MAPKDGSDTLEKQIIPLVSKLDTGDQAGMIMMLLIPYLTVIIARVVIQVMIFFRFAERQILGVVAIPFTMLTTHQNAPEAYPSLTSYAADH